MPEREPEAHRERTLVIRHELAGGVVDGGNVVGIEGMPHPQRVSGQPEPMPKTWPDPISKECGATMPAKTPQPTTCRATMTTAMPINERHSGGVRIDAIRVRRFTARRPV